MRGEDGGLVMETRPRTIGHDPSLGDQREREDRRERQEISMTAGITKCFGDSWGIILDNCKSRKEIS